jgi:predicted RNase H-like nuclease
VLVVGVDGCPGGWLAIAYDTVKGALTPQVFLGAQAFVALLANYPDADCIAVDIPIGLSEGTARLPDVEARRVLGPRRSSVFPAPDPRILDAVTYGEAGTRSRAVSGKGVSQQAFAIFTKIAEVNHALTPALQENVVEVHPEVSFWAMANYAPMAYPKKTSAGFAERRGHLQAALPGIVIPDRKEAGRYAPPANADDVLDAIAAAWTALRFAEDKAGRLPGEPLLDKHGLRMEIVY